MKSKALAPWFGSSRTIAPIVGHALRGCHWVGVPFAGGMCELVTIEARTLVVSDLHRHVINLARVVAQENIAKRLRDVPYHPDVLKAAQEFCRERETQPHDPKAPPDTEWAIQYFIAAWMGRNGKCGVNDEFNGGISVRWNANGGDSALRFRNAARSLVEWKRIMRRCTFLVEDAFAVLDRAEDAEGHGIYCDPPWPDDGDIYKHRFIRADHERLRDSLSRFRRTRVVLRYGDHPAIRSLYPEPRWRVTRITGRTQAGFGKQEIIITNEPEQRTLFGEYT